ncbi:MAG: hypothetical protein OXN44_08915, partial [Acidimicrobiaceae bacterium]|nr:hypothetical protein [Acidimicrobiaceae bacterium]
MSESSDNCTLTIRESYDHLFKKLLFVGAAVPAVWVVAWILAETFGSSPSSLVLVVTAVAMAVPPYGVIAYGKRRAYSELLIRDSQITAGVWPIRLAVIPIGRILTSEVVKIDPLRARANRWLAGVVSVGV